VAAAGVKVTTDVVERAALAFIAVAIASVPLLLLASLVVTWFVVLVIGAFAEAAAAEFLASLTLERALPVVWFVVGA
jgi:hypothetical protein